MQTKILFSLIVLFMAAGVSAQQPFLTVTNNKLDLPPKETSFTAKLVPFEIFAGFGLYVNNPERKKIQLRISHYIYGEVVDTSFTSEQFNRRFNFEQADDGRYLITLVCGKEKMSKTVEINTVTTRNTVIR